VKRIQSVLCVVVGCSLLSSNPASARQATDLEGSSAVARADSLVGAWVDFGRIPGAVLLVSRDGTTLLERGYGHAQRYGYGYGEYGASQAGEVRPTALRALSTPIPMNVTTAFDLASLTKVMATTFAVMLLVDRHELDLDAAARTYLPDLVGGGKESITLRHLLTHRAGLAQWVPVYYHADNADGAYAYIRDLPLMWPVGEGRHYSDLSFMFLGRIVEAVGGAPLDDFVRRELYEPLGLTSTSFRPAAGSPRMSAPQFAATSHGNPYEHRMVHDSTFGYRIEGDADAWDRWRTYTLIGEVNDGNAHHAFRGVAGHAGLFSTAAELDVLLRLLLDGGTAAGRRYLSTAVVREFLEPVVPGQALGWQVPDDAPEGSFMHTGFTGTWVLGVPSEKLSVVLLTNRQNGGLDAQGLYPDVGPLQRDVARALLGGGS